MTTDPAAESSLVHPVTDLAIRSSGIVRLLPVPHPKLKHDPRRPKTEENGDRATVFEVRGA